jgi:hypothetical protein
MNIICATTSSKNRLSVEDLREMGTAQPPCISIYLPVREARLDVRIHNANTEAERQLQQRGLTDMEIAELMQPVRSLLDDPEFGRGAWGTALFRAPGMFRLFELAESVAELVRVGERFYITPLLRRLNWPAEFHLLMLSQKQIRLLRCTEHSFHEVPLPPSVPRSLEEAGAFAAPDHTLENRSTAGPSTGAMQGVQFGTGTDREAKDQYLYHFFKTVDRGLTHILRREHLPLALAGVTYEIALYRKVSDYPHVLPGAVHGSPSRLPDAELHRRAVDLLQPLSTGAQEKILSEFQRMAGMKLVSTDTREIIQAARNGRVRWMLLAEDGAEPTAVNLRPAADDEECNEAALETITHSGQLWLLPPGSMPDRSRVAAIFRY